MENRETPEQGPDDSALEEGLRLLDNSQAMMRTVFLGLALQYRSLDLQRCQLLLQAEDPEAAPCGPEPRAVQSAASLIVLYALFGFQKQAEELARQSAQSGVCPDLTEVQLGSLVILIALIRLVRLTAPQCPAAPAARKEEGGLPEPEEEQEESAAADAEFLDEIEELAEPVI